MRKRKLYLSELLNRCDNKYMKLTIKTQFAYHYFETISSSLRKLKLDGYLDKQVIKWFIKHSTLQETLFVEI